LKRSICGMIIVALLASMIVAVIHVQPVKAGTITVPDDYATIQEAINAASSGDTIFVRNGTYYESVIVNRTVTLLGENPEATVVYANRTGDCLNVTAYGVTVTGFTLQNGGSIYSSLSLFSDGNNITGNTLIDSWCGVFLSFYCQNEIIENNKIEDNLNGISGQLLSDVRIIGNDIRNNLMGIWLGPYCSNSVVSFNNLADSWTQGLYTYAPSYCTFEGNNIASNNQAQWSAGLTLAFQVPYSYGNRFFHNNIANIGQQIELQMATAD
jgi:nitrous oxidase accessory protein NosD